MYKRNQVEGAIAHVTGQTSGPASDLPAPELSIRLKRLGETDRAMTVDKQPTRGVFQTYAFFDEAPPGRGAEVAYSAYSAFALYVGVRLMDAGFPQREAVAFLRHIRGDLEGEHRRILRASPNMIAGIRTASAVEKTIRNGTLAKTIDQMVFVIVSPGDPWQVSSRSQEDDLVGVNICRGPEKLSRTLEHYSRVSGPPLICMELVNPSHQLKYWLDRIEPIKRGRK